MIIFIFFLIIILILIICSITINLCQKNGKGYSNKSLYSGGGHKEDIDIELKNLANNLNTIYEKIEYYSPDDSIFAQNTKTDIINNIIKEYKNNIDYYKVTSREKVGNNTYSYGDKISLDKLQNLLIIGHVPEGHFFLKNGKLINI
jgi:peptidoglycan hydrolase CwlO-like protein